MVVERDYTAIGDKLLSVGPLADRLGFTVKNITYDVKASVDLLGRLHGVMPSGAGAGRPAIDTDARFAEAILAFSGTTNGALATQGFQDLEAKTGRKLVDLSEGQEERRITFAQTQESPQPVITSPEWSGSETGGRRYAAFTINTERLKPWHTLSGRMHFFLDHDWMIDAGEQLPTFRPPLDMTRAFGEPELGPTGEKAITLRYLTVHNKWSIHSEYQDNLFMLSLGRGGPQAWLSVADATSIGVADNDWIELTNANGVFVARAVVTHKLPDGICYVQHAQERTIDVPKSEATGKRGGIHNSVTRILVKPTHLIGGLRPPVVRVQLPRPHRRAARHRLHRPPPLAGGDLLMPKTVAPRDGAGRHGDEPRQVHRLPHLLGHLQAGLDQPGRHRVRVVQQRRDPARAGLSAPLRGPGEVAGRLGTDQVRRAQAALVADGCRSCSASSPHPSSPNSDDYYEPWTYDYQNLIRRRSATTSRWPGPSR